MKIGDYVIVQVYNDSELVYALGKLESYDRKSDLWTVDHEDGTITLQPRNDIEVLTKDKVVLFMMEL